MKFACTSSLLTIFLCLGLSSNAIAEDAYIPKLIDDGKFFGEFRYRYEHVEQDNARQDADAHTIRANIGYQTGDFHDFNALIEGQLVQHIGGEDFDSLANDNAGFSVVADPDIVQLNRAWGQYKGIKDTVIKAGRQFINIGNQRFVGTVGWRQNDQTFDAVTISNKTIDGLTAQYGYVGNVNRIFADGTPPDDLKGNIHLANISYSTSEYLKAEGYGYWMEFDDISGATVASANQSNKTFGVRLSGSTPITEDFSLSYEAEFAKQEDHGSSSLNYDENYYHVASKLSGKNASIKIGHEVLGGDGTNSFRTPLATLHKFNGWADTFLTTPVNGLKDTYISAGYKVSYPGTFMNGIKLSATYHDFRGDDSGDFGSEWDISVGKNFMLPTSSGQPFKNMSVLFKYADYNADDLPYVDTQKFWLQLGFKF